MVASSDVAIAPDWMESSRSSLELIFPASSLESERERSRMTQALEEANAEFRRFSKHFITSAQKESAAIFHLYSHLLSDARLKRELFQEVDVG
ncbi:MAG: phosphoenolpyruvate-utilizing N-terminal domain-containing protein [Symbiopectobacterium sp.]